MTKETPYENSPYEMCGHPMCAHFIEQNCAHETDVTLAEYIHLDNGEKEHDHDAVPSGQIHSLAEWRILWPALFKTYDDGLIGPNSKFFGKKEN